MPKSVVSVIKATPETILEDVSRAMRDSGYAEVLSREAETCLKINVTWHLYMPGTSTTPWQIEGVVRTLLEDGYAADSLWGVHNDTVVVNSRVGEVNNKQKPVCDKYGVWQEKEVDGIRRMGILRRDPGVRHCPAPRGKRARHRPQHVWRGRRGQSPEGPSRPGVAETGPGRPGAQRPVP